MKRYVLTAEAQLDLRQIRDHVVDTGGVRASRYVVAAIVSGFRAVARMPGQGHRREDLTKRDELRFWSVFSYLIVYRIDREPITSRSKSRLAGVYSGSEARRGKGVSL